MGQLGNSRPVDFTVPCKVEAENLPSFKFVTAGDYCSAAISSIFPFTLQLRISRTLSQIHTSVLNYNT